MIRRSQIDSNDVSFRVVIYNGLCMTAKCHFVIEHKEPHKSKQIVKSPERHRRPKVMIEHVFPDFEVTTTGDQKAGVNNWEQTVTHINMQTRVISASATCSFKNIS